MKCIDEYVQIYYGNTKERKPHLLQKIIKVGKSLKIH